MDVRFTHFPAKKIRAFLIFFCLLLVASCTSNFQWKGLTYNNKDQVVAINFSCAKDANNFKLYVQGEQETAVIGAYVWSYTNANCSFVPAIPLVQGQTYALVREGKKLHSFTTKKNEKKSTPQLVHIYPTRDTVPENLLKIYLQFSEPMQETGNVLDFVEVYNETTQKKEEIFLELQTELWNAQHTRLTLWLDPGRIKTNLIPNKEQGLPLRQGNTYTLSFSKKWKSAQGISLDTSYHKTLFVEMADRVQPSLDSWKLQLPKAQTSMPLFLHFLEPMDAILIQEGLTLIDAQGAAVAGSFQLTLEEKGLQFIPGLPWATGNYEIHLSSKTEDLAGNNFAHLFDQEISTSAAKEVPAVLQRRFQIKE